MKNQMGTMQDPRTLTDEITPCCICGSTDDENYIGFVNYCDDCFNDTMELNKCRKRSSDLNTLRDLADDLKKFVDRIYNENGNVLYELETLLNEDVEVRECYSEEEHVDGNFFYRKYLSEIDEILSDINSRIERVR